MITVLLAAALVLVLAFGLAVFFGAPYLPTLNRQQAAALDLLNLKPGQIFYDLGSGDGRILLAAADRGATAIGYEINPFLVAVVWLRSRRSRGKVKIIWGNFWRADISDADAIFIFLINRHMPRLDRYLSRQFKAKKVAVVSHAFQIPGRSPKKQASGLYFYTYP